MEQKPGWTYSYKPLLKMHIAINDKTGIMYTEDKTMYTAFEAAVLKEDGFNFTPAVHILKKCFGGTVIDFCRKEARSESEETEE